MRECVYSVACERSYTASVDRQISDLVSRLPFEPLQHNLDAAFAYAISIVTGMMDVLQSYDMDNCKLPTVGGGHLFQCVCGDQALAIPADKRGDRHSALWCQGPLLLNKWDGEELLVWNPHTFRELLQMGDPDVYLECLESGGGDCVAPESQVLEAQGVELMQVSILPDSLSPSLALLAVG